MDRIVSTLKPEDIDPAVANLQEALRLLLDRGMIRSVETPDKPTAKTGSSRLDLSPRLSPWRSVSDQRAVAAP